MKGKIIIIMVLAIALLGAGAALATVIANSKHDLSPSSTGATVKAATLQTSEICVFCHTPHTAATLSGAPLWNNLVTTQTFTTYGTTVGGTSITAQPAGSTKACLSCHDGVTAINSLYNVPGSSLAGTIAMATGVVDEDGSLLTASSGNLGINLANDHPVSFIYDNTKASLRTLTGAGTIAKVTGAAVVQGTASSATMECASCHSVHDPANAPFLRLSNASSGLCLACHVK